MIITEDWLIKRHVCSDLIEWFRNQSETEHEKIIEGLVKENNFKCAYEVLGRLMTQSQQICCALFLAQQVVEIGEKYKKELSAKAQNYLDFVEILSSFCAFCSCSFVGIPHINEEATAVRVEAEKKEIRNKLIIYSLGILRDEIK